MIMLIQFHWEESPVLVIKLNLLSISHWHCPWSIASAGHTGFWGAAPAGHTGFWGTAPAGHTGFWGTASAGHTQCLAITLHLLK